MYSARTFRTVRSLSPCSLSPAAPTVPVNRLLIVSGREARGLRFTHGTSLIFLERLSVPCLRPSNIPAEHPLKTFENTLTPIENISPFLAKLHERTHIVSQVLFLPLVGPATQTVPPSLSCALADGTLGFPSAPPGSSALCPPHGPHPPPVDKYWVHLAALMDLGTMDLRLD